MLVAPFILFFGTGASAPADTTPPVVSAITVAPSGMAIVVDLTETGSPPVLADFPSAGWAMTLSGGGVTLDFGTFTGSTQITFVPSRTIQLGETGTGAYNAAVGDLADSVGNPLATVSGITIDNQSTVVPSTLVAPVLSHAYSTRTAVHLAWTDATGGVGAISYTLLKNGTTYAAGVTSPYDATTGLSQLTLYSFTVRASDGVTTATSNAVTAGLEYDGTGGSGGVTLAAPTLTAATIDDAGTALFLTFDQSVTGLVATDFTLSTGEALSNAAGSGTAWSLAIGRVVTSNEVPTLAYGGTTVVNADSTAMAAFTAKAVVNGSAITSGSTFPTAGDYANVSDIEDIFGTQNVLTWSDLQNSSLLDTARVARGLAYADNEINLFFADGPFVVPLTGHYTATMTRKWAATLAGIWLYENRGTRDDDKEGHHYTVRRAGIVSEMATFKSGTLRLDAPRRWPSPSSPAAV